MHSLFERLSSHGLPFKLVPNLCVESKAGDTPIRMTDVKIFASFCFVTVIRTIVGSVHVGVKLCRWKF